MASSNKKIADDNATETRRSQVAEGVAVASQKLTAGQLVKALWAAGAELALLLILAYLLLKP